jgi:hypothetical protein
MSGSVPPDRRRRRRYTLGASVRVQIDGVHEPMPAQLADVSATGCFLRSAEVSFLASAGDRIAFGCVLVDQDIALVRGRVIRRMPGDGLGIVIDQANQSFDSLVGALAKAEADAEVAEGRAS